MSGFREFRWKIGAYSAETMPLERLLEYLRELSIMLEAGQELHLVRVDSSSTEPVFKVDPKVAPGVQARARAVRTGIAPRAALRSYRRINKMLREDATSAVLCEDSAEIIPFPGIEEEPPHAITGIREQGAMDGRLVRVGGHRDWVPLLLEAPNESSLTGFWAKRPLAKEIGKHLFETLRLYGQGRWNRSEEGDWRLDHFTVNDFETIGDEPLPDVVAALRSVRARWPKDPIAELRTLRHGARPQRSSRCYRTGWAGIRLHSPKGIGLPN